MEDYNNSAFWSAGSLDTMVFNHLSGGAFIFELSRGRYEMLRVNDAFAGTFGSVLTAEEILRIEPFSGLDGESQARITAAIKRAFDSGSAASFEIYSTKYCQPGRGEYVRITVTRIASCGDRVLFYGYMDSVTAQKKAERQEKELAAQMRAIMKNATCGITVAVLRADGSAELKLTNDRYYELLGVYAGAV